MFARFSSKSRGVSPTICLPVLAGPHELKLKRIAIRDAEMLKRLALKCIPLAPATIHTKQSFQDITV